MNYGFVIDNRKCIGCHACTVACKAEHETPIGVNRTWVKYIEKGEFPSSHRAFSVMRCNHCAESPCTTICPTTALFARPNGIVDFDKRRCIGCKACMQACPYDAIHIDPFEGTAAKCNYCAHRVEIGLEPPCVNVCPTHAIVSGDLDNESSEIAALIARNPVQVRKPEKGTEPNLFYIQADEASLTPGATTSEGSFLWTDPPPQGVDLEAWRAALRKHGQEQAAYEAKNENARKVYATSEPHRGSWGKSVSAYLFTKSVAAGIGLLLAPLFVFGPAMLTRAWVPAALTAIVFLAITNFLLVFKLERRDRFYYVLTKPQWRSWLARGAYIMMGYGLLLTVVLALAFARMKIPIAILALLALGALGTAVYSAFLFNQAKGRDLWQSPVLPMHLFIHAIVAGASALLLLDPAFVPLTPLSPAIARILAIGLALGIVSLGTEFLSHHATADAEAAARSIVSGRFRARFWVGVFALGHLLPILLLAIGAWVPAAILSLVGIAIFEDLYVEAGQAIPLA
jgi:Fe-S-cluster-containing dehydrogenase component/formate-dependent nitrite reductase membrane component NrfD